MGGAVLSALDLNDLGAREPGGSLHHFDAAFLEKNLDASGEA